MSHGAAGGGGFGHGVAGHSGHHGSIQGTNVDPNWTGGAVRAQDGDWKWRWFDRLSPGQVGGLFFLGFILWLFVVYGTSHPPGSASKLADLKNFPSNKYENSIRAASGQQAWERDPTKPIEHAITAPERGSARMYNNAQPSFYEAAAPPGVGARLFSNTQPSMYQGMAPQGMNSQRMFSNSHPSVMPQAMSTSPGRMGARLFSNRSTSTPAQAQGVTQPQANAMMQQRVGLMPAEDLLSADESQVHRPYNAAFGKARQDILPQESVYAAPMFNLRRKHTPAVEATGDAASAEHSSGDEQSETSAKQPWMLDLVAAQPRDDASSALGEIAGRSGSAAVATKLAAVKAMADNAPSGTAAKAASSSMALSGAPKSNTARTTIAQGGNSFFHAITQATPDGVMRTKLVVTR